jgi:hypothetical protein
MLALLFRMLDNVTMYKGGFLYLVSLSNPTTIKSTINSYLTTLSPLNAFLSTMDERLKAQGPLYNTNALLYECLH